jgi:hypothetical protein
LAARHYGLRDYGQQDLSRRTLGPMGQWVYG